VEGALGFCSHGHQRLGDGLRHWFF
jgi:hypothetical protein